MSDADIWYIVNVEAAILREGRYLIITRGAGETHAAGSLSLVGGKVEGVGFSSTPLENTVRREVLEEVGLEIDGEIIYISNTSFVADDGDPVIDIVFLCHSQSGEARAIDPTEVGAIDWLTASEILTHPDAPVWLRASIEAAEKVRVRLGW
ncbi:MAG: NUDIX domain-containing protein [Anaerolineae bacterium]|nr:NUDIX domain-containing protein [Anaerolineae bacterium]